MKPHRYHDLACSIYDRERPAPHRDNTILDIERVLESVYEDGKRAAWREARERAMREVHAAITGAVQSLAGRARTIEIDLAEAAGKP